MEARCGGAAVFVGAFGATAARPAAGQICLFCVSASAGCGRSAEFRAAGSLLCVAAARVLAVAGGVVLVSGHGGRGVRRPAIPTSGGTADGWNRRGALSAAADRSRVASRLGAEVHGRLDSGGLSDESRGGSSLLFHRSGLSAAAPARGGGGNGDHSAQPARGPRSGAGPGVRGLRGGSARVLPRSPDGACRPRIAEPDQGAVHRQSGILQRDRTLCRRRGRQKSRDRTSRDSRQRRRRHLRADPRGITQPSPVERLRIRAGHHTVSASRRGGGGLHPPAQCVCLSHPDHAGTCNAADGPQSVRGE